MKSWGKIASDSNQMLKDHRKSTGFRDLWAITAASRAAP